MFSVTDVELVGELQLTTIEYCPCGLPCVWSSGMLEPLAFGTRCEVSGAQSFAGQHLELKKIQHKYYTLKRAFPSGELTEAAAAGAPAAIVKQACQ